MDAENQTKEVKNGCLVSRKRLDSQKGLILQFPIPNPSALRLSRLGQRCPESLRCGQPRGAAQAKGWITQLRTGRGRNRSQKRELYEIEMQLTPAGLADRQAVTATFFGFIRFLQAQGLSWEQFHEQRQDSPGA